MDPALFLVLAIGGSAISITAAFGLHLQQKLLIEQLKMPGYILDGFNKAKAAKRAKLVRMYPDGEQPDGSYAITINRQGSDT